MEHSVVSAFVGDLGQNGREPEHGESGFQYMLQQYEEVIVRSLITSFGLEAFIKDRRGGGWLLYTFYAFDERGWCGFRWGPCSLKKKKTRTICGKQWLTISDTHTN